MQNKDKQDKDIPEYIVKAINNICDETTAITELLEVITICSEQYDSDSELSWSTEVH